MTILGWLTNSQTLYNQDYILDDMNILVFATLPTNQNIRRK